jgi:hypothetical protein
MEDADEVDIMISKMCKLTIKARWTSCAAFDFTLLYKGNMAMMLMH